MQSAWREPVLNLGLMFLPQSVGVKSVCVKVLPSGLTEEIATICFFTFEYGTLWQGKNWSSKFREACLRKRKKAFARASGMKVSQLTKSSQVQCFAH